MAQWATRPVSDAAAPSRHVGLAAGPAADPPTHPAGARGVDRGREVVAASLGSWQRRRRSAGRAGLEEGVHLFRSTPGSRAHWSEGGSQYRAGDDLGP